MRTTVTVDDDLIATAAKLTGIAEQSALVRAALTALIEREWKATSAARRDRPRDRSSAAMARSGRVTPVDTSIWIDHLTMRDQDLARFLDET